MAFKPNLFGFLEPSITSNLFGFLEALNTSNLFGFLEPLNAPNLRWGIMDAWSAKRRQEGAAWGVGLKALRPKALRL